MAAPPSAEDEGVPKLPIYLFIGAVFIAAPMLPFKYHQGLAKMIGVIYSRVGAVGLLGLPIVTLTLEKSLYDTYTAYHGQDIYAAAAAAAAAGHKVPHASFPSGGASLPSLSLIKTRTVDAAGHAPPVSFRGPLGDALEALRR